MKSKKAKLKFQAWKLFSRYIRLKYSDKLGSCTCFTCGIVKPWKEMQAGHGIGGRGGFILFMEEVVRPQCYGCNVGKGGNYEVFVPKLIELYTPEEYNNWVVESRKPCIRTIPYYEELIDELKEQVRGG